MEFVTTTRGARSLIFEGYRYIINRRGRDDRIFWRCAISRSCSGGLTVPLYVRQSHLPSYQCKCTLSLARGKATAPNLPRVEEFITYFEETWLAGIFSTNCILERKSVRDNKRNMKLGNQIKRAT